MAMQLHEVQLKFFKSRRPRKSSQVPTPGRGKLPRWVRRGEGRGGGESYF